MAVPPPSTTTIRDLPYELVEDRASGWPQVARRYQSVECKVLRFGSREEEVIDFLEDKDLVKGRKIAQIQGVLGGCRLRPKKAVPLPREGIDLSGNQVLVKPEEEVPVGVFPRLPLATAFSPQGSYQVRGMLEFRRLFQIPEMSPVSCRGGFLVYGIPVEGNEELTCDRIPSVELLHAVFRLFGSDLFEKKKIMISNTDLELFHRVHPDVLLLPIHSPSPMHQAVYLKLFEIGVRRDIDEVTHVIASLLDGKFVAGISSKEEARIKKRELRRVAEVLRSRLPDQKAPIFNIMGVVENALSERLLREDRF